MNSKKIMFLTDRLNGIRTVVVPATTQYGPGKCPIIYCPKCEQVFGRGILKETLLSKTDPNFI